MTRKDFKKVKGHNAAIYVLHCAIAVLEQLPGGSEVDPEKVKLWIEEMKEEAGACVAIQDRICPPSKR